MNVWQKILKTVEPRMNKQTFSTWFKPTQFQSLQEDNTLHITVPNPTFESWIKKHYSKILQEAVQESQLGELKFHFHSNFIL